MSKISLVFLLLFSCLYWGVFFLKYFGVSITVSMFFVLILYDFVWLRVCVCGFVSVCLSWPWLCRFACGLASGLRLCVSVCSGLFYFRVLHVFPNLFSSFL